MKSNALSVDDYINELPADRQKSIAQIRKVIKKNLPKGFQEGMGYGMIGYTVPHSLYPKGYHCNPELPLPFINLASQKNTVTLYHMGLYSDSTLLKWFRDEYANTGVGKLDMGKSCIRFKKPENIPIELIGELCRKLTPGQWIEMYEKLFNHKS